MNRRTFLSAVAAPLSAVLLFAACGDDAAGDRPDVDGTDPPATTTPPTAPPTTTPVPDAIEHGTGPDDVVVRLEYAGGFVPQDFLFTRLPRILITGDGSVYTEGAQIEIFPQPLLPPVLVGHIDEARLQKLLEAAQEADLFREVTYGPPPVDITDVADTVLRITVNGTTYVHSAYALGFEEASETDDDRMAYAGFVELLDLLAAEDLAAQPYEPTKYAIRSLPADMAGRPDEGIEPNELDWPVATGVELADAEECQIVETSAVQGLFEQATQITRFTDGDVQYVLYVRPLMPGETEC